MRGKSSTSGFAVAGNDVDDAIGNSRLLNQLAEQKSGERSLFGRLEYHATTGGQSRSEFPRSHQQREIPGYDLADDADGLAQRVGEEFVALSGKRDGVAFDLRGPAGHVAEHVDGVGKVRHARNGDGFAIVERFELREFFGVLFDEIGEL